MADTYADDADGLDFVTTIHRPQLPDVHLGFGFQHQAERACRSLTTALTFTRHVEGTTITWSPRPEGVRILSPVPTDAGALAELVREESQKGREDEFPDLYSRLEAQEGDDNTRRIWSAACFAVDHDALVGELRARLERELSEAIAHAQKAARTLNELISDTVYDVDYAETDAGRDMGHFIDSARRNLAAAHAQLVR